MKNYPMTVLSRYKYYEDNGSRTVRSPGYTRYDIERSTNYYFS
jgi:hypothetical protein